MLNLYQIKISNCGGAATVWLFPNVCTWPILAPFVDSRFNVYVVYMTYKVMRHKEFWLGVLGLTLSLEIIRSHQEER